MVFSGFEFMGEKPFTDIIIHPTVLTKDGKRMSKSLGTGVDPIAMADKYGADAMRFGLIHQMMGGQDIKFDESALAAGKKFANKLWNISRFVLTQTGNNKLQSAPPAGGRQTKEDKEIIEKLDKTIKSATKNIDDYKFGQALRTIYDFVWHDFADVYIEYSKTKSADKVKETLFHVLVNTLKIIHPFMPFITEEIWSMLPSDDGKEKKLLIIEKWPSI